MLRDEAAALLGEPAETLALLAGLHADASAVWPEIVESDRVALPTLQEAEGKIHIPPPEWTDRLAVALAESIGSVPPARLEPRFLDPTFGRLLRSVLIWTEAHGLLLRGRLAYGMPDAAASEAAAMDLTVAALGEVPSPDAGVIRTILSDYLELIGIGPPDARRGIPEGGWDRRIGDVAASWERARVHLGSLARDLGEKTRPLKGLVDETVGSPWRRSLEGRSPIPIRGRVRTIGLRGAPPAAIATDAVGGIYVLRKGRLEAIGTDGRPVVLFSPERRLFDPYLLAVVEDGKLLLLSEDRGVVIGMAERSLSWLPPFKSRGRPRAIAAATSGGYFVAAGSEVVELDRDGAVTARHIAAGEVGDIALQGEALVVSLPGLHRIDLLVDGQFRTLAGGDGPGLTDGASPRLRGPWGLAVSSSGAIGVADSLNHAIREIRGDGSMGTLSGGGSGRRDGPAREALHFLPFALAPLPDGGFAIAERGLQGIRLFSPEGEPALAPAAPAMGIRPPREIYAHLDRAKALLRRGRAAEALPELDRAVDGGAIDSNLFSGLMERASARSSLEDWDGALADFRRAGDIAPGSIDAGLGEAEALLRLDRPDEGEPVLAEIRDAFLARPLETRQRDPRLSLHYLLHAKTLMRLGRAESALQEASLGLRAKESAIKLYGGVWSEEDGALYVTRSLILLERKSLDKALADCDRALEIAPGSAAAHAARGGVLVARKEYHLAGKAFREALGAGEDTLSAHLGLARLYAKELDDPDKSIDHLDRYLTLGGNQEIAAGIMSDLSATASDRRGSYAEVIRVDPNGDRYRLRIYEDGSRVKIPYPWDE